ncbi:MAG: 6-phosphogluconolactonase, partial [Terriglobales bacterium]
VYAELRRRAESGQLAHAHLRCMMLDEYIGAGDRAIESYQWLRRELFAPLSVSRNRMLRLPTHPLGIEDACRRFEESLAAWGRCDLMLLGLGGNGHIAFNEPGSALESRTRVVTLTPETARTNAAYWNGKIVPTRAVTIGIGTILSARRIALLVVGAEKAAILRRALTGRVGPDVPASYLRRGADVQVLADSAAAALLPAGWQHSETS